MCRNLAKKFKGPRLIFLVRISPSAETLKRPGSSFLLQSASTQKKLSWMPSSKKTFFRTCRSYSANDRSVFIWPPFCSPFNGEQYFRGITEIPFLMKNPLKVLSSGGSRRVTQNFAPRSTPAKNERASASECARAPECPCEWAGCCCCCCWPASCSWGRKGRTENPRNELFCNSTASLRWWRLYNFQHYFKLTSWDQTPAFKGSFLSFSTRHTFFKDLDPNSGHICLFYTRGNESNTPLSLI